MKKSTVILFLFGIVLCSCNTSSSSNNLNDSINEETAGNKNIDTTKSDDSSPQTIAENVSADWLLIPGEAAGGTRINENADSVYQRLGTPDGGDAAMQKAVAIWWAHHDTTNYSTAIYTARNTDSAAIAKVLQIRVTSPFFKTKEGIHTTSSIADIKKVFTVEQTEKYTDGGKNYVVNDSADGIAFEMDSSDHCVAIIIHKKGITNESTYLKFRTTNKFINPR